MRYNLFTYKDERLEVMIEYLPRFNLLILTIIALLLSLFFNLLIPYDFIYNKLVDKRKYLIIDFKSDYKESINSFLTTLCIIVTSILMIFFTYVLSSAAIEVVSENYQPEISQITEQISDINNFKYLILKDEKNYYIDDNAKVYYKKLDRYKLKTRTQDSSYKNISFDAPTSKRKSIEKFLMTLQSSDVKSIKITRKKLSSQQREDYRNRKFNDFYLDMSYNSISNESYEYDEIEFELKDGKKVTFNNLI